MERERLTTFKQHNRAAAGNRGPVAKQEVRRGRAALLWLMGCIDEDGKSNWHKLWDCLLDRALAGDVKSARVILDFSLGAPRQTVDVSTREHIDEIPAMHDGLSLVQMADIYARTLRARGRPGDGGNLDEFETPALPAPSADERTAAAGQWRVPRDR
jgi:hypothetical protein